MDITKEDLTNHDIMKENRRMRKAKTKTKTKKQKSIRRDSIIRREESCRMMDSLSFKRNKSPRTFEILRTIIESNMDSRTRDLTPITIDSFNR